MINDHLGGEVCRSPTSPLRGYTPKEDNGGAAPPTPARGGCLSALPSASAHRPPAMGGSRKRQPPPSGRVAPASLTAVSGH